MIKISYIEENLDKLNSVYSLISLLDVHYAISHHNLSHNISNAKEHLSKAISCLASDINEKLINLNKIEGDKQILITTNEINSALQDLQPFFAGKELKNCEVLEHDAQEVLTFLSEYQQEQDFDLSDTRKLEELKKKLTFFVNNQFKYKI